MEDWPDWHHLAPAFVAAYGAEELQELESAAVFLQAIEEQGDVSLTEADRLTSRRWRRGSACIPRCGPWGTSRTQLAGNARSMTLRREDPKFRQRSPGDRLHHWSRGRWSSYRGSSGQRLCM
jgi:hypothetical protein